MRTCRSLLLAIFIALASRATALAFIPLPNPIPEEAPPARPSASLQELGKAPAAEPTPAPGLTLPVGVSFVFGQVAEDLTIRNASINGTPVPVRAGHFDTSSYLGRIDTYVLGCTFRGFSCREPERLKKEGFVALNVNGSAGYTTGESEFGTFRQSISGPTLGAGAILAFATDYFPWHPVSDRHAVWLRWLTTTGFDYATTSFENIDGWTNVFQVKPRAGVTFAIREVPPEQSQEISFLGGAEWEHIESLFTGPFPSDGKVYPYRLDAEPRNPWSALLAINYRNLLGIMGIGGFDLTLEGQVGNRTGVNLTARYQFDVPIL